MTSPAIEIPQSRELRRQIRAWRRGRAELRLREVLSDAYIAVFAVVMIVAMAASMFWELRSQTGDACTGTCAEGLPAVPWLTVLVIAAVTLGVCRLLGPVFVSPATGPWLLSTPVDRGDLLRPAWLRALVGAALLSPPLLLVVMAVTGTGWLGAAVLAVLTCAVAIAAVGASTSAQISRSSSTRIATWVILAVLSAGLVWLGFAPHTITTVDPWGPFGLTLTGAALVSAVLFTVRSRAQLPQTSRSALLATESAWPSLSGAVAAMDPALLYDVLVSRRWAAVASVKVRRGGPQGWWSLVHRDILRVGRSPQPWILLAGLALIPYALSRAGLATGLALVIAGSGALVGPWLASSLRVVCRTPTLARTFPFPTWSTRLAHLVVPGTGLIVFAMIGGAAMGRSLPAGDVFELSLAAGISAIAATARWIAAPPPDYGKPMLTTPVGGLPPGLLAGLLKGFDVWLVTAVPLLFPGWGVNLSVALSLAFIIWSLHRS